MSCLDHMDTKHFLEMLVSSIDEHRAFAHEKLEGSGIPLSGGLMYLISFSIRNTDDATLSTIESNLSLVLSEAQKLLSAQFTVYLFTSSGVKLMLLYQPDVQAEPDLIASNAVFLEHMSRYLIGKYQQFDLQILVSRETENYDRLGFFFGALVQASSVSAFLTNPPKYAVVDFERQNASYTVQRLQVFRDLVLKITQLIRAGVLNPRRSAEEICALVLEHTELSTSALHRHMDMFAVCFMERMIEDNIVDSAFLHESNLFNELMLGNNEVNYTRNLERILTLINQRHISISQAISSERMKKIKLYVEDNISDVNLSVMQIADHFSINRGTLSEEFRKYFGCFLSVYIQKQRITYAQQLLDLYPELSIQEVSVKAGYADISTMYRAFKRSGLPTPNALRRAAQRNSSDV